jgi:tRNA pseudouridine13 synthase
MTANHLPGVADDLRGIGGRIRVTADDFDVTEIAAYEPCGSGDHLYLWIEKRDMGGEFFARQVAKRLNIPPGEVGTAGLKDRHAVTRQWVSVPAAAEANLAQLEGDGLHVLKTSRHTNKLKTGHLHGNRFRILVREVVEDAASLVVPLVERLRALGLPNYYGPQRFGRGGETLTMGWAILKGEGRPPRSPTLKRLALSAVQSDLFNKYLAARVGDGLLRTVLDGDVLAKWPFGGLFVAEDVAREQARLDAREIVPAGPIFGLKTFAARGTALEREQAILQVSGLTPELMRPHGKLMPGTRRHGLIYLDDLQASSEAEGVRLEFTLPAGSYATVVLAEIMKAESAEGSDEA